jgi:hypothetical protein
MASREDEAAREAHAKALALLHEAVEITGISPRVAQAVRNAIRAVPMDVRDNYASFESYGDVRRALSGRTDSIPPTDLTMVNQPPSEH